MKKPKRYTCGNGEGMFDDKKGSWISYEEHINIVNKLKQAINYSCCSTQLKDKYGKDFEYFVTNQVNVRNVGNIYWFKGVGYADLDELYKKWLKITKPLIV